MTKGKITQLQGEVYLNLHVTTEMMNLEWGKNWKCMQIAPYRLFSNSDQVQSKIKDYTKCLMKEKYKNCIGPSKVKCEIFLTRSLDKENKMKGGRN